MLRWLGAVMIISGSLGLGLWYREQFQRRLALLKKLFEILEMLISEVRYGKSTLPECCRSVGRQAGPPFSEPLLNIYKKMQENTGDCFGDVFCGCMEEAMKAMPLTEADKEIFFRIAGKSSFPEGAMQLKWMEQSRDMLGRTIAMLEEKTEEKCRIAVGLGAMGGLLTVIVLL